MLKNTSPSEVIKPKAMENDKERGVIKLEKWADVVYGWPISLLYNDLLIFFVVTTIKTTTYSTATTVTDAKEHDPCPDCLRKDFAYVPKKLLYQPITGQLISEHIFIVNNCIVP